MFAFKIWIPRGVACVVEGLVGLLHSNSPSATNRRRLKFRLDSFWFSARGTCFVWPNGAPAHSPFLAATPDQFIRRRLKCHFGFAVGGSGRRGWRGYLCDAPRYQREGERERDSRRARNEVVCEPAAPLGPFFPYARASDFSAIHYLPNCPLVRSSGITRH